MKFFEIGLLLSFLFIGAAGAVSETVYVQTDLDTDGDGVLDRLYVTVKRPGGKTNLPTIFKISPYTLGGNNVDFHDNDVNLLPQDEEIEEGIVGSVNKSAGRIKSSSATQSYAGYAEIAAHSLGTGYSTGCPSVGDLSETYAAKSVIDWLNGRAKAYDSQGREVSADWASGSVGMIGVSYDGTLPTMVATTGVEGLNAIVPVGAISNWYDYYRANGLVVNPGGYVGEDADILGKYIVRKDGCQSQMDLITKTMGRENGDFTPFWQSRDYVTRAKGIKAATFIIHGQSDWNVKQKHAIGLWSSLGSDVPKRMFLHKGGHMMPWSHGTSTKVKNWFDHYVKGDKSVSAGEGLVEVELEDGSLMAQKSWPHEKSVGEKFFFGNGQLSSEVLASDSALIVDSGKSRRMRDLSRNPEKITEERLVFTTDSLDADMVLSGTPRVNLKLKVLNRKAANITVALVEYDKWGRANIVTRGWADPQNHNSLEAGKLLVPGASFKLSFDLEPKQYLLKKGSRLGVVLASTDYEYTLRPDEGTEIEFEFGRESFIELNLIK